MANQLIQEINLRDNGYSKGIKSAQEALSKLADENGVANVSFKNQQKELNACKRYYQSLKQTYEGFSDAVKKSDVGKEIHKQMTQAKEDLEMFMEQTEKAKREYEEMQKATGKKLDGGKIDFGKITTGVLDKAGMGGLSSSLETLGGMMGGGVTMGAAAMTAGIAAAGFAVKEVSETMSIAVEKSAEFGQAMSQLGAITGVSGKELDAMKEQVKAVGRDTNTAFSDVAKNFALIGSALPYLLQDADGMEEVSRSAVTLSKAGLMPLDDATKSLTSTMAQFGLGAEHSAQVSDILANAAQKGSADIGNVAETLQRAGTAASAAGVNLEEAAAMTEVLAEKGLKGAEAGTALRNVLMNMSTKGIDEINPKVVGTQKALENLQKYASDSAMMVKIFGQEGATAATILANGLPTYNNLVDALDNAGTAAKMAEQNEANLASQWENTKKKWENLLASMNVDGANSPFMTIVNQVQNIIDALEGMFKQIGRSESIAATMEPINAVIDALGQTIASVISIVGDIIDSILKLVDSLGFVSDETESATAILKILENTIWAVEVVIHYMLRAVNLITDGWKKFKGELKENITKIPLLDKVYAMLQKVKKWINDLIVLWGKLRDAIDEDMAKSRTTTDDEKDNKKKTNENNNVKDGKYNKTEAKKGEPVPEKGKIEQLQAKIKDLQSARDKAQTNAEISKYNKQIKAKQDELNKLNNLGASTKGGGSKSEKKESPKEKFDNKLIQINFKFENGLYDNESKSINEQKALEDKIKATEEYINELSKNEKELKKNKVEIDRVTHEQRVYRNRLKTVSSVVNDQKIVKDANEEYAETIDKLNRDRKEGWISEEEYNKEYLNALKTLTNKYRSVSKVSEELKKSINDSIKTANEKQKEISALEIQKTAENYFINDKQFTERKKDIMSGRPKANEYYDRKSRTEDTVVVKEEEMVAKMKAIGDWKQLDTAQKQLEWMQKNNFALNVDFGVTRDDAITILDVRDALDMTEDEFIAFHKIQDKVNSSISSGWDTKWLEEFNKYIRDNKKVLGTFADECESIDDAMKQYAMHKYADEWFDLKFDEKYKQFEEFKKKLESEGIKIPADITIPDLEAGLSLYKNARDKAAKQTKGDKSNYSIDKTSYETINKRATTFNFGVGRSENFMNAEKTSKMQKQLDELLDKYKELEDAAVEYNESMEAIGEPNLDGLKKFDELDTLEKEIDNLHDKLQDRLTFQVKVEGLADTLNGLEGLASFGAGLSTIADQFESISERGNEVSQAFEYFGLVISTVQGILEGYNTVMTIINGVQDLFAAKSLVSATATGTLAGAETAQVAEETASIPAKAASTAANKALEASVLDLAAAQIFAAHAAIPFVGPGIATGLVTAMMATMTTVAASSKALAAFANGGVVTGDAFHGDSTLVRANKGEMILNNHQQANLFNALNSAGLGVGEGGEVEFKLRGDVLVGLLKNHSKIKSKTGHKLSI